MIMKRLFIITIILFCCNVASAQYWDNIAKKESTLDLKGGMDSFDIGHFKLKLIKSSQTVAALSPSGDPDFDYTPGERLELRDKDSLYHLGDINLRIRKEGEAWKSYSTAWNRSGITPLKVEGNTLAGADLENTLPKDIPVSIKRYYETNKGDLILRFNIVNRSSSVIEIGALGVPMIFNNILEGKSLEDAHKDNVFFDPYMGEDAGYLEVKRLDGEGPVLLVLPQENMPFENYRPLLDDLDPRTIVFEGFHEWMSYSKAYSEEEWEGVKQWNTPTSIKLKPNESRNFSLKFVLAPQIDKIQETLQEYNQPTAFGVPGYVLPKDVDAKLFLKYVKPITSIKVTPENALDINRKGKIGDGYDALSIRGNKWGRARLEVTYQDGKKQTIHYKVIDSEQEAIDRFGHFLMTEQWFDDKSDPFDRAPSVISYDYGIKQQVTEEPRVWVAGLSDEAGAGSWLGALMKQLIRPDKKEVHKLEDFINKTIWGGIQYEEGENKYGVKKSVFYYEPEMMPKGTYRDDIDFGGWMSWNKKEADNPGRSYNYPHVTAAYWVMYRLARYYDGLVTQHGYEWYLKQAYHTVVAMDKLAPYYAQFGQMEGTIFLCLLNDLNDEGEEEMANKLTKIMKKRADHWDELAYPFGSEMPWDSTGQEEVFMWSDYFGFEDKAKVTLNAILAYMPTMPHWAYNGSARRYWDFVYAGKLQRIERQLHHYESGLSALPVLKQYRKDPDNLYLLKVGYGGLLGAISNITRDGFGPAAFHSFPSTLAIDSLSGDYGSGFLGYALNTGTYLTHDNMLGWLTFGGNLMEKENSIRVDITTAGKNRFYLAPEKLYLELRSGRLASVVYKQDKKEIILEMEPKNDFTSTAYITANQDLHIKSPMLNGAYAIKLGHKNTKVHIKLNQGE